jgi:hypothetical protein
MPDNQTQFVFNFTARLNIDVPNPPRSASSNDRPTEGVIKDLKGVIKHLNGQSDQIAEEIEQQLRPLLPERGIAHVAISFSEGSLIALGTTLVTFLSPIVGEALKKVLEEQIKSAISFAITRVLPRYVRPTPIKAAPEIDVSLVSSSTVTPPAQPNTPASTTNSPPTQDQLSTRNLIWLTGVNAVLLVFLLVTILLSLFRLIP